MTENRHIGKIIYALIALALAALMIVSAAAKGLFGLDGTSWGAKIAQAAGNTGITQEYESKLFDTDTVMTVDIIMDDDKWQELLDNAIKEEYYECDVVINGEKFYNVGIRAKGNTSLTNIARDETTDRYSFKLQFDEFVKGQTCYGLDKLILNNNYADATNMKEAVIYDMFAYLGADASLYNYSKISVNGEYIGVYLALEGVEDSFLMRNYGTGSGELYKPENMDFGDGPSDKRKPDWKPDWEREEESDEADGQDEDKKDAPSDASSGDSKERKKSGKDTESGDRPDFREGMPEGSDFGQDMPEGSDFGQDMPEGFDFGKDMPEGFEPPEGFPGNGQGPGEGQNGKGGPGGGMPGGSGGMGGGGGSNLEYTDDDLDSYSTIWNGEIGNTSKKDHKRVVKALKAISEGDLSTLEEYMDIDNLLKYMAVHEFSVNGDSLSGGMAHNYYLYESDGQLNIIPWDYNLSFGGMNNGGGFGGGPGRNGSGDGSEERMGSADATSMINDPIDESWQSTSFFDILLENEEYSAKYHEYLQMLVDYVEDGKYEELTTRLHSQIDELVKNDPTAFYSYDEYTKAYEMLDDVVHLRAESIQGQLDGTIPSTSAGQKEDQTALIDGSGIDTSVMGKMGMGR